jgi:hypothetical protein
MPPRTANAGGSIMSGFPDDFPGLFVVSKRNKLRVTKMVCVCPFQKVYAGYGLWFNPHA